MLHGLIPFCFPGVPHVRCAFGTRSFGSIACDPAGGVPAPPSRQRLASCLPGAAGFAEARQVHGVDILYEPDMQDPGTPPLREADGMAGTRAGLALMIKTADCQPILLAHEGGRHILALHCGWRGSRQDFPCLAVQEFCAHYRLDPAELWAVRGPSLGPTAAEFVHFDREWGRDYLPWYRERERSMDLWSLTRSQLVRAGLKAGRVLGLDLCTFEGHETFFSYRHHRKCGSEDGRQPNLIWIAQK